MPVFRRFRYWLKAGPLEAGVLHQPDTGTSQGGVVSPLIADVVLHDVPDQWLVEAVQQRLWGRSQLLRFPDDWVMTFADNGDKASALVVRGQRLARYGPTLHATPGLGPRYDAHVASGL